jgi:tetrahydromethanopterin S-methyltransferase subunit E
MRLLNCALVGVVFGALEGVSIFFEPREPYKWQILCAATLKGLLVGLLTGFSVATTTRWWSAMAIGALYGLGFSLVVYLSKGAPTSGDAPYVIPSGIITGALIGLLIVSWAIKTI